MGESVEPLLPATTKLGQGYVFTGVSDSVHRGVGVCQPQCMLGSPLGADTPWSRHPLSRHPPRADAPWEQTPWSRHPPSRHPPEQTPPRADTPQEADSSIRSTSGRYASYWNAFLFSIFLLTTIRKSFGNRPIVDRCESKAHAR